uniref:Clathrin heavy chain, putative n=1 Tax=Arundo donax TaxID=35708 RepID=A0A0A9EP53_ARUDO
MREKLTAPSGSVHEILWRKKRTRVYPTSFEYISFLSNSLLSARAATI